jgi:IS5 family transposase
MFIELALSPKNRKQKFLTEMEGALPWGTLLSICKKKWKTSKNGRPKYELEMMLKVYFLQQWYCLGDPTVEAEIYDSIAFRLFLGINDLGEGIPDESTILRFRRFLEDHKLPEKFLQKTVKVLKASGHILKRGTIVDATIIKASSSTKNKAKSRDPEMNSTQKNNNYYFGMKQHIGVDADKGLIHTLESTTAKVHDSQKLEDCLHGEETIISGDKAYGSKELKQKCRNEGKTYLITDKRARRRKPKDITEEAWSILKKVPTQLSASQKKKNKNISSVRSKVEHPFRIIKHLWGHRNVRYKGILKNNLQWNTLAMLSNFYMIAKNQVFLPTG